MNIYSEKATHIWKISQLVRDKVISNNSGRFLQILSAYTQNVWTNLNSWLIFKKYVVILLGFLDGSHSFDKFRVSESCIFTNFFNQLKKTQKINKTLQLLKMLVKSRIHSLGILWLDHVIKRFFVVKIQ